jgi:hypothetical protein
MMMMKHQSSILEITIAAVVIATVLALSVLVLVTQEANAAGVSTKASLKQTQLNRCTDSAKCSNTSMITLRLGGGGDGPNH